MAGYYEKRSNNKYKLVVDLGTDIITGKRKQARKTVECTSERQAKKELDKFKAECARGVHSYSGKATVSFLCDKYIDEYASTKDKKSTLAGYKSIIDNNIKPIIGKLEIGKITPLHVQEWTNYLNKEKDLSPKTLRNCLSLLRNIFNSALSWGFITSNPCVNIALPAKEKKEVAFYNEQQIITLLDRVIVLDNSQIQLKASIMLALFSGLRMGELAGLRWSDIDLQSGEVSVTNNRLYRPGYGTYDDTPKTSQGIRRISLPQQVTVFQSLCKPPE